MKSSPFFVHASHGVHESNFDLKRHGHSAGASGEVSNSGLTAEPACRQPLRD